MKHCIGCNQTKQLDDFGVNKSGKDGRRTKCKICCAKDAHQYRKQKNPIDIRYKELYKYTKRKIIKTMAAAIDEARELQWMCIDPIVEHCNYTQDEANQKLKAYPFITRTKDGELQVQSFVYFEVRDYLTANKKYKPSSSSQ